MNLLLLTLVFQSSLLLPPRTAVEDPAVVSQVPQKLQRDYQTMWRRFISGKDDAKLGMDVEKILQRQKTIDPLWVIEGYLALYRGDDAAAREKFMRALAVNANNRIAIYYLAELAYAHQEYARAATLYAQLISIGANPPELETKRQRAFLLATDDLLRAAARAESENRLAEAEDDYRQALRIVPEDPTLYARLADLLIRENKREEAAAARKAADDLAPRRVAKRQTPETVKSDDLEDLGRWGSDIGVFHQIRDSSAVTRQQVAVLLIRYFPQLAELPRTASIVTDIQSSPARQEIQIALGIGLMDSLPNHDFQPTAPITRGDFAKALARVSRMIGVSSKSEATIAPSDVASTNALYPDLQLVLGSGLLSLRDSGRFDVSGDVTGVQAVGSMAQLMRSFQQVQR